jgi:hypothetical protein
MKCFIYLLFSSLLLSSSFSEQSCTCSCTHPQMEELGAASWKFLHSMAANYHDQPPFHLKYAWYNVMELLVHTYPCPVCRDHLWQNIEEYGVHVQNRTDVSMWLCWLHNEVNKANGKPIYPCSIEQLDLDYNFNSTRSMERRFL